MVGIICIMFKNVGKIVLAYCDYVGPVAFVGVSTMTVQVYILKVIVKCTEDAQASGYQGDTGVMYLRVVPTVG